MAAAEHHVSPKLSVVVTLVSGPPSLERTLAVLAASAPFVNGELEIVVPYEADRAAAIQPSLHRRDVRFLALGELALECRRPGAFQEHERYDRRRAAGLAAARGDVVALLEDHGTPADGWPDAVLAAFATDQHTVVGGIVDNAVARPLQDAAWLCDFWRHAPPGVSGPRNALTDVNVAYRRGALAEVREAWCDRFQEPRVHAALQRRGATLWLDPKMVVRQERTGLRLLPMLRERVAWGRVFGEIRGRELPPWKRPLYAAASLLLPPLLLWRLAWNSRSGVRPMRWMCALPIILPALVLWCLGESLGTATTIGRPRKRSP